MKLHSRVSVITNSSSELFSFKSDHDEDELKEKLIEIIMNSFIDDDEVKRSVAAEIVKDSDYLDTEDPSISIGYGMISKYSESGIIDVDKLLENLRDVFGEKVSRW